MRHRHALGWSTRPTKPTRPEAPGRGSGKQRRRVTQAAPASQQAAEGARRRARCFLEGGPCGATCQLCSMTPCPKGSGSGTKDKWGVPAWGPPIGSSPRDQRNVANSTKTGNALPIRVFLAAGAEEGWLCGKAAATGWQQSATAHRQALRAAPEPPHAEHGQSVCVGPCGGLPLGSDPQPLFRTSTLGNPEHTKPTSQRPAWDPGATRAWPPGASVTRQ